MAKLDRRIADLCASPAGLRALTSAVAGAEAVVKASTSVGRARGRGQSSKAKGRAGVQQVKALLAQHLGIADADMLVKATSMPGADLYLSPTAKLVFPFAVEVKFVESLNIWAALAQAEVNAAKGETPIVFFKRSRTKLYVALDAEAFLRFSAP